MNTNEFKDRLFDALNESNLLPIQDIRTNDKQNTFRITLWDDSEFELTCMALECTASADILCFPPAGQHPRISP